MRVVVGYESMFGNTRRVAEAIGDGLRDGPGDPDVQVIQIGDVTDRDLQDLDLLVVGAPTHVRGLPRESTRQDAVRQASAPEDRREVEPEATDPGVREWLDAHPALHGRVAVFDTRVAMSPVLTGRASKGLGKRLRRAGADEIGAESFLVDKDDTLLPGELARAARWGLGLASRLRAQSVDG
jgi:hypothetical protein